MIRPHKVNILLGSVEIRLISWRVLAFKGHGETTRLSKYRVMCANNNAKYEQFGGRHTTDDVDPDHVIKSPKRIEPRGQTRVLDSRVTNHYILK